MSQLLVSIIIPTYNDSEYLPDAINSALNQTYTNIEIIVINDGSNRTQDKKFFEEFPFNQEKVQLINKKNEGLATARNTGLNIAKGQFFVPLDADDKLDSQFIEKTLKIALENEKIGVVYTDQQFFGEEYRVMPMKDFNFEDLLSQNHVSVCSLVRITAYHQVKSKNGKGYNPNMIYGYEDWDFWISLAELGWEFSCLHEPLFFYRKRNGSMISRAEKNHEYLMNQLIENHKDTYQQNFKQALLNTHSKSINTEISLKNIEKDTQNKIWLIKKFIKNIFKK